MERPSTSKPRGICKYYQTKWGCLQGSKCKFLHGEEQKITPYDERKTCRFFAQGYCKRGANCWFRHVYPDTAAATLLAEVAPRPPSPEEPFACSICLEPPVTFGLLTNCSHVFCIECLRKWRDSTDKSGDILESRVNKKCPYCRTFSRLIIPSSHYYPDGHQGKAETLEKYKGSLARVHCKYFQRSQPTERCCPFGKDCYYKHENEDGTPYVFEEGVEYWMNKYRRRLHYPSHGVPDERITRLALNYFLDNSFNNVNRYVDDIRDLLARIPDLANDGPQTGPSGARNQDPPTPGLRELSNQLMAHVTANLNAVFARPAGEAPVPNDNNPPGPSPNIPLGSWPTTATDPRLPGNSTHRRRPPRTGSPVPSDVGSMPELETVSDSSVDEEEDHEPEGRFWGDDDDPPWSSEDEEDADEGPDGGRTSIELGRIVEAIQNMTLGDSGGVDGEEPESHFMQHDSDPGQGFHEPPPPASAFNSEEDEEAVPNEFLTALATMSGMIGSGPESEHVGGEGSAEEGTPPLELSPPVSSSPAEMASLAEPSNPTTTSQIDIPSTSSHIPPVGSDATTAIFPSSDTLPSLTQPLPSPSTTDHESATATRTLEPPAEAGAWAGAQPSIELPPDPPFMTDGRGRVVWSRAGSKSGPSSPAAAFSPIHGRVNIRTMTASPGAKLTELTEVETGEGEASVSVGIE